MAEMTAVEYFREKARMTKRCAEPCAKCLLANYNNGDECSCILFEQKHTDQAIAIVQKWSQEHPSKTILQDFLEKYPSAPLEDTGIPLMCPEKLGYLSRDCSDACKVSCVECWNQPLETGK